jgi:hypothetical protein
MPRAPRIEIGGHVASLRARCRSVASTNPVCLFIDNSCRIPPSVPYSKRVRRRIGFVARYGFFPRILDHLLENEVHEDKQRFAFTMRTMVSSSLSSEKCWWTQPSPRSARRAPANRLSGRRDVVPLALRRRRHCSFGRASGRVRPERTRRRASRSTAIRTD